MVELHKEDTLGRNGLCQPRASSVELLASGKFVISGRAASCNKPSTRNGGINLHSEVVPQRNKRSPRVLHNNLLGQHRGPRGRLEHTNAMKPVGSRRAWLGSRAP